MTFGERLRTARVDRRLSQTEIGGNRYSASYISHLERDRRRPTPEVVSFLANQLGVPPSSLATPPRDAITAARVEVAVGQLRLQDALLRRDFDAVITETDAIAAEASLTDASAWWAAMRLRAEALIVRGDYDAGLALVEQLLGSEMILASQPLRASVLVLHSRTLRATGRLPDALDAATNAVDAAESASVAEVLAAALLAKVAALAELGQRDELDKAAQQLTDARASVPVGQLRGEIAWSLGNVRFLQGRAEEGIEEHDQAADLLDPMADLRAWARFHKASAAMRLGAGVTTGVEEMLERAQTGLSIVGTAHDFAELDLVRAEFLMMTEPDTSIRLIDAAIATPELPAHTIAEAHTLKARVLDEQSGPDAARAEWATAAELYEESGAHERATAIWRRLAR
ncbi:helix-turn-helix domain-containing protein [Microbacterium protaetiae]|nr:helix-turn-helix transcriptional regulator [Microbacterium protaetiae]